MFRRAISMWLSRKLQPLISFVMYTIAILIILGLLIEWIN